MSLWGCLRMGMAEMFSEGMKPPSGQPCNGGDVGRAREEGLTS